MGKRLIPSDPPEDMYPPGWFTDAAHVNVNRCVVVGEFRGAPRFLGGKPGDRIESIIFRGSECAVLGKCDVVKGRHSSARGKHAVTVFVCPIS
jgi:hypothetical protein